MLAGERPSWWSHGWGNGKRDNGDPPRDNTNEMKRLSVWFQIPIMTIWFAVLILMYVEWWCWS